MTGFPTLGFKTPCGLAREGEGEDEGCLEEYLSWRDLIPAGGLLDGGRTAGIGIGGWIVVVVVRVREMEAFATHGRAVERGRNGGRSLNFEMG